MRNFSPVFLMPKRKRPCFLGWQRSGKWMAAAAANRFLFCGSILQQCIVQRAALAIEVQTWVVAFAEAVEICLCRLALQMAEAHECLHGDVSVAHAAAQGLVHRLGVVHLAVAHAALLAAETVVAAVGIKA